MTEWQPIETAPKDGRRVLLCRRVAANWQMRNPRPIVIGHWVDTASGRYWAVEGHSGGLFSADDDIDGWMPLPEQAKPGDAP